MQEFPCINCRVERLSRLCCSPVLQLKNVKMDVVYGSKARKRRSELKISFESFKIGLVHCHSMQYVYSLLLFPL